jgi:hypothetical protein
MDERLRYICGPCPANATSTVGQSNGALAQLVEQWIENPCVPSSILGGTTNRKPPHPGGFSFTFNDPVFHSANFTATKCSSFTGSRSRLFVAVKNLMALQETHLQFVPFAFRVQYAVVHLGEQGAADELEIPRPR